MAEGAESFGYGEEAVEEKRSLVGTALARCKPTTRREKRLIDSPLFEPLLANLLAFVKAFQRKHKAENPPPPKPGREPVRLPEHQMNGIVKTHDEMLHALSRSYLTIVIEFSDHRNLLSDQKFFKWLHVMLCQFIENSLEKNDPDLMDAVKLELHRIFQGDRFNTEAKKPEQIKRLHKRKMKRSELMRMVPALSKEMGKNSPVVAHLLPSQAERVSQCMKGLEAFQLEMRENMNKASTRQSLRESQGSNHPTLDVFDTDKVGRRDTRLPRPQTSLGSNRPQSSQSSPNWAQQRSSTPASRSSGPASATIRRGGTGGFVTDIPIFGHSTANQRERTVSAQSRGSQVPKRGPESVQLPAHGGWEARVHSLTNMEKRGGWKVKTPVRWVNWQDR